MRLDDYDVNLEHQRIGEIRGLEKLENVECLCLRNNMIRQVVGVNTLLTLTELDLYDNMIKKIENIDLLVNLTILDFRNGRIVYQRILLVTHLIHQNLQASFSITIKATTISVKLKILER